ncbi:MAG: hypothetical protein GXP23_04380 [Gammaproteobacteria bacterium]|nr:hypothetical protein [Gammaproteobacteria bacterium]
MSGIEIWTNNVLIVEDDVVTANVYRDIVKDSGGVPWVTHSLDGARNLMSQVAFGVALVDLSLTGAKNRDGLKVLDELSKSGDGTRSTLLTNFGDLKSGVEAVARYGGCYAYDKDEATYEFLSAYLPNELGKVRALSQRSEGTQMFTLKPEGSPSWKWEDELQSVCKPKGGIGGLYKFWDEFLPLIVPLQIHSGQTPLVLNPKIEVFLGVVWSRGCGHAIGIGLTDLSKERLLKNELESPTYWTAINPEPRGPVKIVKAGGVVGGIVQFDNVPFGKFHDR